MPTTFNTLPPELQGLIVSEALEVSPEQDSMRTSKLPLYEKNVALKLASVSSAFLDHVVVACHSKRNNFLDTFLQLLEICPRKQQDMVCKYSQQNGSDYLASMHTLEKALPRTSPLFKWLHCGHCDMVESHEKAMVVWVAEMKLLCKETSIVEDLVKRLDMVRSQIGTCPPPERLRPLERRGLIKLSITVTPVRN